MVVPGSRPHSSVGEVALLADVVGREPAAMGLGHDQRGTVLGDGHAVGECEVIGDQARGSLRSDEDDEAWCRLTAGEVEADIVDVRVAARVNHDVVPWLLRDGGEACMGDHRPVRLAAEQPPLRRVHHQQTPVRQEIDAHRKRRDVGHDLVATVGIERNHLMGAPVGKPDSSVVPAR